MCVKNARSSKGQRTARELLETARRLFSIHGYHDTSTYDIFDAATFTKGAFYHHFKSKEHLAQSVLDAMSEDYDRLVIDPAEAQATGKDKIEKHLDLLVELNEDPKWVNCRLFATMAMEMTEDDGVLRVHVQRLVADYRDIWQRWIVQAQREGTVADNVDPRHLAQLAINMLFGGKVVRKLGSDEVPERDVVGQLKALVFPSWGDREKHTI